MGVRVIQVPPGYSKEKLLKDISSENFFPRLLFIAPTQFALEKVESLFYHIHREKRAFFSPTFLTLNALSHRIVELYTSQYIMDSSELFSLFYYIIDKNKKELKSLFPQGFYGISSVVENAVELYEDICFYLPEENIDSLSQKIEPLPLYPPVIERLSEIFSIFEQIDKFLKEKGYIPPPRIIAEASHILKKIEIPYEILILDGFYDITPQENIFLKTLFEKIPEVYAIFPSEAELTLPIKEAEWTKIEDEKKRPLHLSIHSFPSPDDEVEGIGRKIKKMLSEQGFHPEEIMVAFPGLRKYAPLVDEVFEKLGIPHRILLKKPLTQIPQVRSIFFIIDVYIKNFSFRAFNTLILSPYFHYIPVSLKENLTHYAREKGILQDYENWERIESEELRGILKIFEPLMNDKKIPLSQWIEWLLEKLKSLGWLAQSEENDIIIKEKVTSALYRIQDFPLSLNIQEFRRFLFSFLNKIEISVYEIDRPGIDVVGIFKAGGVSRKVLFFGGMNEGEFPSLPEQNFFLPEEIKERLGLPTTKKVIARQKFIKSQIWGGFDHLYLTFPTEEDDRPLLPSPFIGTEQEIIIGFPEIEDLIFCEEDRQFLLPADITLEDIMGKYVDFSTRKEIKKYLYKRFGRDKEFWITELERYLFCPYKYYIERVLNADLQEDPKIMIEKRELGIFFHNVLKKTFNYFIKQGIVKDTKILSEVYRQTIIQELKKLPYPETMKEFIKLTLLQFFSVIENREMQLKTSGFSPFKVEFQTKRKLDRDTILVGRADRIDRKNGTYFLIDYKIGREPSGKANIDKIKEMDESGERFYLVQLPLYTWMVRDELKMEKIIADFYTMRKEKFSKEPFYLFDVKNDIYRKLEEDILNRVKKCIEEIRRGFFAPIPWNEEKACGINYPLCSFKGECPRWMREKKF